MNVLLGKIDRQKLTKEILWDLRNKFDYQLQPNDKEGEYFGCHLCMDRESARSMKTGNKPDDALILFITPEVFELVMDEKFEILQNE